MPEPRHSRKTIGEEGSRRQTLIVFVLLLFLGLLFYLPQRLSNIHWPQLPHWQSHDEVITITNPNPPRLQPEASPSKVKPDLESLIADQPGQFGIVVQSLSGNEQIQINEHTAMTAASVIKLPVLIVYYQAVDKGSLDPNDEYVLQEADRWVYGSGTMQYQPAGTKYIYQQVAQLVANQSDNMAAEVLIKKLGGYPAVQKKIDALSLDETDLQNNKISTADAAGIFLKLAQGKLLSSSSRKELFTDLTGTVNEDWLPGGVPADIQVAHKFGEEDGVVNDCGIVEEKNPYVICVLTTDVNAGDAEGVLVQISAAVWNWLGD